MNKYDVVMMQAAHLFSKQSYAKKMKVGAVLARNGRILITGYNGTIAGTPNECESVVYVCPNCGNTEKEPDKSFKIRIDSHKLLPMLKEDIRKKPENLPVDRLQLQIMVTSCCVKCSHNFKDSIIYDCSTKNIESYLSSGIQDVKIDHTSAYPDILQLKTNDFVLHAEQNVISYAAKKGIATEGCDLYITHTPCKECAKLIAQAGIARVVCLYEYRDLSGVEFLKEVGVKCERLSEKDVFDIDLNDDGGGNEYNYKTIHRH
ncbi:deoxycytidylate deaminase [Campylobacter sp. MOP51]|uniref:deoxycytidylate deaminase n=1 Tax=Campylobacter canis TaxID=3378588 RepID=UPI003C5D2CF5